MSKKQRVESFKGYVNCIHGDTAFIALVDEEGTVHHGMWEAKRLAKKGITSGDEFRCKVYKKTGKVKIKPAKQPSKKHQMEMEMQRSIGAELIQGLASFLHDLQSGQPIPCTRVIRDGDKVEFQQGVLGGFNEEQPPEKRPARKAMTKKVPARKKTVKRATK